MSYLTYQEYQSMHFAEIEVTEFDILMNRASDVLDSVTRDFYQFNDLDADVLFRREKFKKAVACQIEYFHEMGATTSHGLSEDATVQIGRTSLSKGAKGSVAKQESNNLVSTDALMYLTGTGLLYSGIGVSQ